MVDKSIITAVKNYLGKLKLAGFNVRFGVLFGSHVSGNTHQWSDIDLMVVSPEFDGIRNNEDMDRLWRIAARTDSRIEPVPCGEKQWVEDDVSTIIEVARREGQLVTVGDEK